MPKRTANRIDFGRLGRCLAEAKFDGGALSFDGGLMLLRQLDRKMGLSATIARALHDPSHPERNTHSLQSLIAQRLYGVCWPSISSPSTRPRRGK